MKKLSLLTVFIFICFQLSYGQKTASDSLRTNPHNKIQFGFYITPTYSFNSGKKIVPHFYDGADCNCGYTYNDLKESGDIGYNIGIEVETKEIWKRIFMSFGIDVSYFQYSGTGEAIYYSFWFPQYNGPSPIEYSYQDYFIDFPILVHYSFFRNNTKRLNIFLGPSPGLFLKERNSGWAPTKVNEYNWRNDEKAAAFIITGIDCFFGKKTLLNLGFRITSQLATTPKGRRLTSAGIKVGILF
jgi:hypothetical protein